MGYMGNVSNITPLRPQRTLADIVADLERLTAELDAAIVAAVGDALKLPPGTLDPRD